MVKRPTTFSMRMPEDLNEKILEYAAKHNCTKAEAMSHFARAGIDLEENGPAAVTPAADVASDSQSSADPSVAALEQIRDRLDALQSASSTEPTTTQALAVIPTDIKDKIQAYSSEHECSEQEALTYYARIGVQMSASDKPASAAEVAELSMRIDTLAKDNASKGEQLKQMTEVLYAIRDYTKPDELELEGEVAEEAEDVESAELTDEERQAIADEHTRKIVSDIMGEYTAKQIELEAKRTEGQKQAINPWIPVLVAVIVSLFIGIIVVVLTR